MNIRLHAEAKAEFDVHLDYYGSHAFALTTTEDFRLEMDAALDEIGARPLTYRLVDRVEIFAGLGRPENFVLVSTSE